MQEGKPLQALTRQLPQGRAFCGGDKALGSAESRPLGEGGIAAGDDGRGACYRQEAFLIKPKPPCRGLRGGFGHRKENNMKKQRISV